MKKMTKSRVKEFSKRILAAMAFMWFVGAVYGMAFEIVVLCIAPEMASIDGLLVYVGAPVTGGLMTYLIKSALENKEKIKQDYDPNYDAEEVETTEVGNNDGI